MSFVDDLCVISASVQIFSAVELLGFGQEPALELLGDISVDVNMVYPYTGLPTIQELPE